MFFQSMIQGGATANTFREQKLEGPNHLVNKFGHVPNPKRAAKRARQEANKLKRAEEEQRREDQTAQMARNAAWVFSGRK